MGEVRIKRIYEDAAIEDGIRVLVDRIWPRGVSRVRAQLDAWLKQVAPSTELRAWFAHDPEKFNGFVKRYRDELDDKLRHLMAGNPPETGDEGLSDLLNLRRENPVVTLLYSARDHRENQAAVLGTWLQDHPEA